MTREVSLRCRVLHSACVTAASCRTVRGTSCAGARGTDCCNSFVLVKHIYRELFYG
jgi:hypothetical protein